MVGKLRVHDAVIIDVKQSEHSKTIYRVTIEYQRRMRTYDFILNEGDARTNKFLKFINVNSIQELKGKTVKYIAAEDLKEPGKDELWLLVNESRTRFYDITSHKIVNNKKVKQMVEQHVFSEF